MSEREREREMESREAQRQGDGARRTEEHKWRQRVGLAGQAV